MPGLPQGVLDAAIDTEAANRDQSLSSSIQSVVAPIKQAIGSLQLPGLSDLLGSGQPDQAGSSPQPQPAISLPSLDSVLGSGPSSAVRGVQDSLGRAASAASDAVSSVVPRATTLHDESPGGAPPTPGEPGGPPLQTTYPTWQPPKPAAAAPAATTPPAPLTHVDTSSKDANLRSWAPALQDVERRTGLRADALAAIIQAENGGGQSPLSAGDNNYFSITAVDGRPHQAGAGAGGRFAHYNTPQDSLDDFVDLIQKHYPDAWANRGDPQAFFQGLIKGHYIVPEPGFPVENWLKNLDSGRQYYAQNVAPTVAPPTDKPQPMSAATSDIPPPELSPNGTPITAPSPPAANEASRPTQFAEGLSWGDSIAACGLAGATWFALKYGRTPTTVAEVKQAAQANDLWDQGAGMHGAEATVRLIRDQLHVPVHLEGGVDWDKIRRDVLSGNPVMFDTNAGSAGHYYTVEGARQRPDGVWEYNLGTSATDLKAAKGRQWFTADEIPSLGFGAPSRTIFMDNPLTPNPAPSVVAGSSQTGESGQPQSTASSSSSSSQPMSYRLPLNGQIVPDPLRPPDPAFPDPEASRRETQGMDPVGYPGANTAYPVMTPGREDWPIEQPGPATTFPQLGVPPGTMLRQPLGPATPGDASPLTDASAPTSDVSAPDVPPVASPSAGGTSPPVRDDYAHPQSQPTADQQNTDVAPSPVAQPSDTTGPTFQDDQTQGGWVQPAMAPGPPVPDMRGTSNPNPLAASDQSQQPSGIDWGQGAQNAVSAAGGALKPVWDAAGNVIGAIHTGVAAAGSALANSEPGQDYGTAIAQANAEADARDARVRSFGTPPTQTPEVAALDNAIKHGLFPGVASLGDFMRASGLSMADLSRGADIARAVLAATPTATADVLDSALATAGLDRSTLGVDLPVVGRVGLADALLQVAGMLPGGAGEAMNALGSVGPLPIGRAGAGPAAGRVAGALESVGDRGATAVRGAARAGLDAVGSAASGIGSRLAPEAEQAGERALANALPAGEGGAVSPTRQGSPPTLEGAASPAMAAVNEIKQANLVTPNRMVELIGDRPEYLADVAQHILDQRRKVINGEMTVRDIAKAYYMTLASQGADAIKVSTVESKVPGFQIPEQFWAAERAVDGSPLVRPEEAAAAWLFTPNGQAALNDLERGVMNRDAWRQGQAVRTAFGDDRFKTNNVFSERAPVNGRTQFNMDTLQPFTDRFNEVAKSGNPAALLALSKRLNGISEAKAPFLNHALGFGETPTIDAVEISAWLTGQGDVSRLQGSAAALKRQIDTQLKDKRVGAALGQRIGEQFDAMQRLLPPEATADLPPEVFNHVLHHWIWDRMKGTATTHTGFYDALRNAALPSDATRPIGPAYNAALGAAPGRALVGGVTGAATGGAAGYESSPQDATPGETAARTLAGVGAGALVGATVGGAGTLAAGRAIDSLVERGALNPRILATHPQTPDRIRAMFSLAAEGLPDNATVPVPDMVSAMLRMRPQLARQVGDLVGGPVTAGQVRQIVGSADSPGVAETVQSMLVDALSGLGAGARRGRETAADAATVRGLASEAAQATRGRVAATAPTLDGPTGPAKLVTPEQAPNLNQFVGEVADRLGVARPGVYVAPSPIANAAATTDGKAPALIVTRGLLNAGLTEDEMAAVLTHELAHTAQDSRNPVARAFGAARDALGNLTGSGGRDLQGALPDDQRQLGFASEQARLREQNAREAEQPSAAQPRLLGEDPLQRGPGMPGAAPKGPEAGYVAPPPSDLRPNGQPSLTGFEPDPMLRGPGMPGEAPRGPEAGYVAPEPHALRSSGQTGLPGMGRDPLQVGPGMPGEAPSGPEAGIAAPLAHELRRSGQLPLTGVPTDPLQVGPGMPGEAPRGPEAGIAQPEASPLRTSGQLPMGGMPNDPLRQGMSGLPPAVQTAVDRGRSDIGRTGVPPLTWLRRFGGEVGNSAMLGVQTLSTNLFQNLVEPIWSLPKELTRAALPERVGGRGNLDEWSAGVTGRIAGFSQLGDALVDVLRARGRYAMQGAGRPLSQDTVNPVGRAAARFVEAGGRVVSGVPDAIFGTLAQNEGDYRFAMGAVSDAVKSGTLQKADTRPAWAALVQDVQAVRNGQLPRLAATQSVIDQANAFAKRQVMQDDLGDIGKKVQKWATLNGTPVLGKLITPYFPTPWNAGLRTAERTPILGAFMNTESKSWRSISFDKAYDQVAGTALVIGMTGYASSGLLTGKGPSDPEKRNEMMSQGWRPYSSLVNGVYVPNRLIWGNMAYLANGVGDFHDALAYRKPGQDIVSSATIGDVVGRVGSQIKQQPFLQGISDALSLLDPSQAWASKTSQYAASTVARMVPYSANARALGTALDPNERTVERGSNVDWGTQFNERLHSALGLRAGLPVAQDVLGRPQANPQQGLGAAFAKTSPEKADPIIQTFLSNGVDIGFPRQKVTYLDTPLDLSEQEQRAWNEARGAYLVRTVNPATIANIPPGRRQERLNDLLSNAADAADRAVLNQMGPQERARRRQAAMQTAKLQKAG